MTAGDKPLKESIAKRMHQNKRPDASGIEVNEGNLSENFSRITDIKIAALMKLTAIPQITVIEPDVSVTNGTLTLHGIVDAFWKKASLETIMNDEFPDLYVENALNVIPPGGDTFPPGKIPVDEPGMFHGARSVSDAFKSRPDRPEKKLDR